MRRHKETEEEAVKRRQQTYGCNGKCCDRVIDRCQDDKQYCSYRSYKLAYPCFVAGIYATTYEILPFACFRINYSIAALSIASIRLLPP